MITLKKCTVFNSDCDAIVNTVNCVGTMGAGLALEFALRYPELEKQYKQDCLAKKVKPGSLIMYEIDGQKIINFPTKFDWKYPSKLEWISLGLDFLVKNYKKYNIKSIAIPPLGCSLGGLNFEKQVYPLIKNKFSNLPINVVICLDTEEARGIEKWMLIAFKEFDFIKNGKNLKLRPKTIDELEKNKNKINRFFQLKLLKHISKENYKNIFRYFYNNVNK